MTLTTNKTTAQTNSRNHGTHRTHFTHLATFPKAAFTLAEVLITLAIIGVVAALTIPSLVQRYQERQYVTHLKKSYAVLQNAFQMAIAEHGTLDQWGLSKTVTGQDEEGNNILDYTATNMIFSYLEPYLKIASYDNLNEVDKWYSLDGREVTATPSVDANEKHQGATLADGTYFQLGWVEYPECTGQYSQCGDFWIWLPAKKQQLGVTRFNFYITKNGILPKGQIGDMRFPFDSTCDVKNKSGQNSQAQGRACTAWALYEGNMEYRHCDDLSWGGKKKCD